MKKFNTIFAFVICFFVVIMVTAGFSIQNQKTESSREYLVEVNEIMNGMKEQQNFFMPDLHEMKHIKEVNFLSSSDLTKANDEKEFLEKKKGYDTRIEPLILNGELLGLVSFTYTNEVKGSPYFLIFEGIILCCCLFVVSVLLYMKYRILKPFITLSNMPYELSKGHFSADMEESKYRFFGKFVWGINMLRDNLRSSHMKELELEKEKKMMLLSISHDIKTPLNSIKLYSKALDEGIYETEEEKREAARHIERLSKEIENFVKDIIKASSEEVIHIDVENSDFYISDFITKVKEFYEPKCKLILMDFKVEPFCNKLLKGNEDSAFEVVENIMENAFKYGDGRKIEFSFYEEEYCQIIKIKNSGKPAKEEEIPHLFDSFFRGTNVGDKDGNGLGLYICREIMRKMDGDIFAKAEEDGMAFHLVFRC